MDKTIYRFYMEVCVFLICSLITLQPAFAKSSAFDSKSYELKSKFTVQDSSLDVMVDILQKFRWEDDRPHGRWVRFDGGCVTIGSMRWPLEEGQLASTSWSIEKTSPNGGWLYFPAGDAVNFRLRAPNEMSLAGRIFTARSLKDPKVLRWQQLSTVGRSETFKRLCETVWIPANDFGIRQQKKLDSLVFLPNGELLRKMKDGSTRKTRWSLEGLISNFGTKINSSIGLLEHDEQRILDGVSYASLSVSREKENHLLDLESLGTYQRDSKLARSRGLVCPDTQYIDVTFSYPRPIVFNRPVRFDVELKYPASDPQVGKMASLDLLTVETMNDRDAIKSLYNWSTKKFGTYEASTSRVPLSMVSIWPVRKLRGNFEVSFDRAKPTLVSLYLPARARLGEDSYSKVDWCARFALTP